MGHQPGQQLGDRPPILALILEPSGIGVGGLDEDEEALPKISRPRDKGFYRLGPEKRVYRQAIDLEVATTGMSWRQISPRVSLGRRADVAALRIQDHGIAELFRNRYRPRQFRHAVASERLEKGGLELDETNQAAGGAHKNFRVPSEKRAGAFGKSARGVLRRRIDPKDELAVRRHLFRNEVTPMHLKFSCLDRRRCPHLPHLGSGSEGRPLPATHRGRRGSSQSVLGEG